MGWLGSFGLKLCQSVDLDEENLDLMSVCSESLIFDRFRFRNPTWCRWNASIALKSAEALCLRACREIS